MIGNFYEKSSTIKCCCCLSFRYGNMNFDSLLFQLRMLMWKQHGHFLQLLESSQSECMKLRFELIKCHFPDSCSSSSKFFQLESAVLVCKVQFSLHYDAKSNSMSEAWKSTFYDTSEFILKLVHINFIPFFNFLFFLFSKAKIKFNFDLLAARMRERKINFFLCAFISLRMLQHRIQFMM